MSIIYSISGIRKIILYIQKIYIYIRYYKTYRSFLNIYGIPIMSFNKYSSVKFGKNISLISHSYFSEPGINHPVVIRTLTSKAKLILGNNVGISGGGICCAEEVVIGNDVMVGANTIIMDTDFHSTDISNRRFSLTPPQTAPVHIENNVFLGMNVLVLKGVRIGENSIIAAGSIVTKNIPENVIAAGIPAKVIKKVHK